MYIDNYLRNKQLLLDLERQQITARQIENMVEIKYCVFMYLTKSELTHLELMKV